VGTDNDGVEERTNEKGRCIHKFNRYEHMLALCLANNKTKNKNRNQTNILSQNSTTAHTHAHNEHTENQSAYTIPGPHPLPGGTDKEVLTPLLFFLFSSSVSRHRALSCYPRRIPSP